MTTPLISVIIPVYNAEPWLREALDSLREQTHADFEAIMVCDGCTDRSEEICREYGDKDPRFVILVQPNQGVSAARNNGVTISRGEWICFMDADDRLPSESLSDLLKAATLTNTKIAVGRFQRGLSLRPVHEKSVNGLFPVEIMSAEEAIVTGLYQKRILNSPWGVIFHRHLFFNPFRLLFRDCRYEDLDFFYRAFERTDRICLIDKCVYFYRDNPASFINTWSRARLDALEVTDRISIHMQSKSERLQEAARDRRFSAHFNIMLLMLFHGIDLPEQKERCMQVIRESRLAELRDPDVRLKNKLGALVSYLGMPAMRLLCKFSH